MKVTLEEGDFNWSFIVKAEDGRDVLIQTDWEYPMIAEMFGWSIPCTCGSSDGTVDCPSCKVTASEMIHQAYEFLSENIGKEVEDTGLFEGEQE